MTGLMAPAFLGVLGLGIDVSYWEMVKIELQRTADIAALAGAINYVQTNNDQNSAIMAAFVAEQNGIAGASSRSWNAPTLSDNLITVSLIRGVQHTTDRAFQVAVVQPVPLFFSRLFARQTSPTVTAVATAEIGPARGAQPCILALAGDGSGVTTDDDILLTGNADITLKNCTLRSDAGITVGGSASVTASSGIYAAGSVTTSGSGSTNGSPLYQNAGQIPDPYAQDAAAQAAFAQLGSGGQLQPSGTLSPGTYSSLDFKTAVSLNPGLYIVNGPISFEARANVSGTGVTIVSSGDVTMNGNAQINLSAGSVSTGGAIPGILYANPSSSASLKWNGASTENLNGVFYAPNTTITINGNASSDGQGCLEAIAANVDIKGTANLAANCTSLNAIPFGSLPGAVSLVR